MRATILVEVSRRLVRLLEEALSEASGVEVPVYLSHPLDPLGDETSEEQVIGLLYPVALRPARVAAARPRVEGSTAARPGERLRFPGVWVEIRYLFLASGGRLDEQLALLESALRAFHDTPYLRAADSGDSSLPGETIGGESATIGGEPDSGSSVGSPSSTGFPLRVADATSAWQELGLPEHRLAVGCEVTVELPSARTEPVDRTLERAIDVREVRA